jgi:HD-GYP domain-containing protein (c-di-GMP phosphodiesterase class II)
LADPDVTSVRRAGFLHDLGRTGVPNGIWEKALPCARRTSENTPSTRLGE